jgi:predicted ATP-binding protein involved in virulence
MIKSIDFKLVGSSNRRVQIELESKNLIITGGNGCGKTRFLGQLKAHLEQLFSRQLRAKDIIEKDLEKNRHTLTQIKPSDRNFVHYQNQITNLEGELERLTNENITLDNLEDIFTKLNSNQFILREFKANRLANNIASNGQIESMTTVKSQGQSSNFQADSSDKFEKYLVSYYNYGSHVMARENNPSEAKKVDDWFDKVQSDLCNLFEDPDLLLKYSPNIQAFNILQNGKDPYRFNQLSSGYSSILCIYADLLMKVELREISADELTGIVFIDEIDAHLHVSLQRKIFSFFDRAFPKIQFIVTTHSPFVIQSVNDSIIYDLSKLEQLEDLSMYSYESILKGLLGVSNTSNILNERLDRMAKLIHEVPINAVKLKELLDEIAPHENQLDSRSRAFVLLGKNALLDSTDGEE